MGNLVRDVFHLMLSFGDVILFHVYRETNQYAS